ncbi:MAG: LUD domain-containing protein [Coriobacteriia bacterium]|nr:LUD domain-containing protein [Coriobacteriia bacterium]
MTQRPGPTVTSVFIDRLTDYKATVARASNSAEVSKLVFGFLREVGAKSVVVPPGINKAWLSATVVSSIRVLGDSPALSKQTLNKTSAVITAASAAIAETGTIILDHRANQGRRVISLLPDTHICIVKADQILESVSDTGKKLSPSLKEKRPMTWISGPSATVDIELIRVEGVHGPRNLFVIIVD